MKTMGEVADTTRDFAYWGDSREWFVVYGMHRDSDIITRGLACRINQAWPTNWIGTTGEVGRREVTCQNCLKAIR